MHLIDETDPRLRAYSQEYDFESQTQEERLNMVHTMLDLMEASRGIGLAAPQVGMNIRLFVMQAGEERFPCFNPKILSMGPSKEKAQEGCLSFPGLRLNVSRHSCIMVSFLDVCGIEVLKTFEGLDARCFQHELDHLNGTCFDDTVGPLALQMAKKRRLKERKSK